MVWIHVFRIYLSHCRNQQKDQFIVHRGSRRQKEQSSWDASAQRPKLLVGPESDLLGLTLLSQRRYGV